MARGTHVEVDGCALQIDYRPAEDGHDRPVLMVSFFDEGLRQHTTVRVSNPTYALFDDDAAEAEFARLIEEGKKP